MERETAGLFLYAGVILALLGVVMLFFTWIGTIVMILGGIGIGICAISELVESEIR